MGMIKAVKARINMGEIKTGLQNLNRITFTGFFGEILCWTIGIGKGGSRYWDSVLKHPGVGPVKVAPIFAGMVKKLKKDQPHRASPLFYSNSFSNAHAIRSTLASLSTA